MSDDKQKDVKKDKFYRQTIVKDRRGFVQKPVEQVKNQKHEEYSIKTFKEYNKILNIDSIARRYIAMNGFDGVLAILGIVISSFIAGVADSRLIISVCLGAAIAMAVSGVWGAYMAEAAERKKELKELEGSMLTRLKKTKIGRAGDFAAIIIALIDGAAPFISGILVMMPFVLLPISIAYYVSFVMAFILLFMLGIFLGKISKENLILSGVKMLFAGVVILIIVVLLGAAGH